MDEHTCIVCPTVICCFQQSTHLANDFKNFLLMDCHALYGYKMHCLAHTQWHSDDWVADGLQIFPANIPCLHKCDALLLQFFRKTAEWHLK